MKAIEQLIRKIETVLKRENARITFEVVSRGSGLRTINVFTSARISMKGRYIIEKVLGLRMKTTKNEYQPMTLGRRGSKIEKDGTEITLTFYDIAQCKVVGTKKEIRKVKKVIVPEKIVYVKEEVDVPIYECPKGTVLK
jgi:hypothetical protein